MTPGPSWRRRAIFIKAKITNRKKIVKTMIGDLNSIF